MRKKKKQIIAIAAIQPGGGLGKDGKLLARIPSDLSHFKATTMGSPVIMGRKTWESLPNKRLPGRMCIVLTRNKLLDHPYGDVVTASSKEDALNLATQLAEQGSGEIFIAGGGEVYQLFLEDCDRLIMTELFQTVEPSPDTFFPEISIRDWGKESIRIVQNQGEIEYSVITYLNLRTEEVN